MHEPARLATTAVSLPAASERLDIENSETAPNRPRRGRRAAQAAPLLPPSSSPAPYGPAPRCAAPIPSKAPATLACASFERYRASRARTTRDQAPLVLSLRS